MTERESQERQRGKQERKPERRSERERKQIATLTELHLKWKRFIFLNFKENVPILRLKRESEEDTTEIANMPSEAPLVSNQDLKKHQEDLAREKQDLTRDKEDLTKNEDISKQAVVNPDDKAIDVDVEIEKGREAITDKGTKVKKSGKVTTIDSFSTSFSFLFFV